MIQKYPNLCKPITLGRVTFRNRMFSAPMGGTDITADCCVGPRTPGFYELRAKGGAAAVTASELVVHPETDASHMFHLNLTTPGCLASWTWTADAISRHGAVASVELSHSGQYAGTYLVDKDKKKGLSQFGPSDWVRPDGIPVKALTREQIQDIVKAYGDTAGLAKRAGFQMVMVHGGHGWLLNQFLSPAFNHRTDEYGGCLENRLRLAKEVVEGIKQVCGANYPVLMRLGLKSYATGLGMGHASLFGEDEAGRTIEEGVEICKKLEEYGYDALACDVGIYEGMGPGSEGRRRISRHAERRRAGDRYKCRCTQCVDGIQCDDIQANGNVSSGRRYIPRAGRSFRYGFQHGHEGASDRDEERSSGRQGIAGRAERPSG